MVVDAQALVAAVRNVVNVVRGHQDGAALVPELMQHVDKGFLGGDVNAAERLVQQQDIGSLSEGTSYEDTLSLSAG